MERVDCIVIGAGVIGLAVARRLALDGREVVVLEAEEAIGTHTSSRNSEVIHAGIYYTPGSLKAQLCVPGRQALYRYCEDHGIGHRRCGKLIVAAHDTQRPAALDALKLHAQAGANGVDDLRRLPARTPSPWSRSSPVKAALLVAVHRDHRQPCSHAGLRGRRGRARGGAIRLRVPVQSGRLPSAARELEVGGAAAMRSGRGRLVNSAGLTRRRWRRGCRGLSRRARVPAALSSAKGTDYSLSGRRRSRGWSIRCRYRPVSASI